MRSRALPHLAAAALVVLGPLGVGGGPAAAGDDGLGLTISPTNVVIDGIGPGVTRFAQLSAANTSNLAMTLTISGQVSADHQTAAADVLVVDLAGCSQPWTGLPDEPTCGGTKVSQPDGTLPVMPLPAGSATNLLIAAGLGPDAGNGAQGQTWTATLTVVSEQTTTALATANRGHVAPHAAPSAAPSGAVADGTTSAKPGYTTVTTTHELPPALVGTPTWMRPTQYTAAVIAAGLAVWIVLARRRRRHPGTDEQEDVR